MRKGRPPLIIAVMIALLMAGTAALAAERQPQVLFQNSTIQALMVGVYGSNFSFGDLAKHGNFGLGTCEGLDGEVVALDGKFYQVRTDGKVYPVAPPQKTPFCEVVFFKPGQTLKLSGPLDLTQLEQYLSERLPSRNFPYAFKITGAFSSVKTRSVPRQVKPYPPLLEVVKHQQVFEFKDVQGVIVGFYHPQYLAGVNVAGYHCHFLTADRRAGGHLLDCRLTRGTAELQRLDDVQLRLPHNPGFARSDLSRDKQQEIEKVEK